VTIYILRREGKRLGEGTKNYESPNADFRILLPESSFAQ